MVKISEDSTNMGKRIQVENFTYTLLDEEKSYSYEACHPLAIFRAPEKYESLKTALQDIIEEISRLIQITVDDHTYSIEYYMGGDWKFLAMVTGKLILLRLLSSSYYYVFNSNTGIDSATSEYACIWCKCSKKERYDPSKTWSLTDEQHGARSMEENVSLAGTTRKKYNVSNLPLFPTIPLCNVVIDNLHLFLRVSDVLIDLLVLDLKRKDAIDKVRSFSNFNVKKYQHIARYEQYVINLGISGFQFYVGRASNKLKCRSLTGTEKLKVFQSVNIATLLPSLSDSVVLKIQRLWNELLALNTTFSKRPEQITTQVITQFEKDARQWGQLFIETYHDSNVTPYIHALMNHVSEFLTIHGSILPFTQQSLEKYNDVTTKDFFRATNHRGESALRQIMEKQNRQEYLRDPGYQRLKTQVQCNICKGTGHNKRTCSQNSHVGQEN